MSFRRPLALALLRCARQLLPASRREWAQAMHTELDHVKNDSDALAWAIGCVVAGAKARINTMFNANLKVSRWILVPEMLLCFLPLTFGWLEAIGGSSGIIRLNGHVVQKYFLQTPGGTLMLVTMIGGVVLGALGPLGLLTAARLVVSGRTASSRWFRFALVGGPTVYGLLMLLTRLALAGTNALSLDAVDSFDFWSGIVLLAALPSLGAAHILYLAKPITLQCQPVQATS